MKLYTKTGDDGTTGLFGGGRVPKDSARVAAYGTVDETNAAIGVARATKLPPAIDAVLERVQEDLFTLGAELACVPGRESKLNMPLLGEGDIHRLEVAIDEADAACEPLKSFVLPGDPLRPQRFTSPARSAGAPRGRLSKSTDGPVRSEVLVYLNRLSDLLFALARRANAMAGVHDVPWKPRSK